MAMNRGDLHSFGALLKAFRARRRLTQQQLAEVVGIHRNALGRWEQGNVLPATKGIVLELARHLHLDELETRQLLEASLTALSPHWSVPFPHNPFFTGREEILEELHRQLGVDQVIALTQPYALHGLGGIGKTQIALEYAHRHALDYSAVFWIGAETIENIVSGLLRIAEVLQLPERAEKDQQRIIEVVQHWLTIHDQWLIIWDNVEDLGLLQRFLPAARQGAVLLTTRRKVLGTLAWGMDLLPMEQEEGMLFLLRRAKVLEPEATGEQVQELAQRLPTQYAAAAELVTAMGGLPLAIDQAGAYIEETQCSLPAYLELFRTQRVTLLQQRGAGSRDHPESVSTTFTLAITATARHHPAVGDLLRLCALLQLDTIPEELFRQGAEQLGAQLQAVCRDTLEWNRVVAIACSYSLLHRQPEEQMLSMHRLVQAVLLDTMTEEEQEQWTRQAIGALDTVFPEVLPVTEHTTWKQCERLLTHVLLCLNRVGTDGESLALASLAYKTAQYLRARGQYAQAEPILQRALRIREQVQGPEHPDVARILNYLAVLYWSQGKYAEAEPLYQRALSIREHMLSPDQPEVATSLNNLALLYWSQGRYTEAEPLYQRTLYIREQTQGSEHPDVATSLNNLAALYWDQGRYAEAEPLYRRALGILEQALGSDHSLMAQMLNNLALVYQDQDKDAEAEPLYRRALGILEQALGPDHPEMAQMLNNLASLLRNQGKDTEAEQLYRRALRISEQSQGPRHPDLATSLNGLACLFRDHGHHAEAEPLFQRALAIREQLGQHHPETAQTLHELAILQQQQGNLGEALSLAERALQTRSQALGDTHPKTVATRTLYAQLIQAQAHAEEGRDSQEYVATNYSQARKTQRGGSAPASTQAVAASHAPENDPLEAFLAVCCELHPRAWCRASDLWQAYERWAETHQERYPLSRGAFIAQLKAHGCRADRTKSARVWRGIALVSKNDDGG